MCPTFSHFYLLVFIFNLAGGFLLIFTQIADSEQEMAAFSNYSSAGETRKVLFEHHDKNGMMEGYTDNYIRVSTPYREEWVNEVVEWRL